MIDFVGTLFALVWLSAAGAFSFWLEECVPFRSPLSLLSSNFFVFLWLLFSNYWRKKYQCCCWWSMSVCRSLPVVGAPIAHLFLKEIVQPTIRVFNVFPCSWSASTCNSRVPPVAAPQKELGSRLLPAPIFQCFFCVCKYTAITCCVFLVPFNKQTICSWKHNVHFYLSYSFRPIQHQVHNFFTTKFGRRVWCRVFFIFTRGQILST